MDHLIISFFPLKNQNSIIRFESTTNTWIFIVDMKENFWFGNGKKKRLNSYSYYKSIS